MSLLPGDPGTLGAYANRYPTVAETIARTSLQLKACAQEVGADGFVGGSGPQGDRGAMKDLDSNLVPTLTPRSSPGEQRAVTAAMLGAGIGKTVP